MKQTYLVSIVAFTSPILAGHSRIARTVQQQSLRASICDQENLSYDRISGRCFNARSEPSDYNCALINELYDNGTAACVPTASLASSSSSHNKRWLPNALDSPSSAACKALNLIYDPTSQKCFDPALHPSPCNCAYVGLNFNAAANDCVWSAADQAQNEICLLQTLLWNPNTQKCYSPALHPSVCNCEYYSLSFDTWSNTCTSSPTVTAPATTTPVDTVPTQTPTGGFGTCTWGQLPDYTTGQCVSCGACNCYPLNAGQQVCTNGQCSVICPDGSWAVNKWGVQYCQ